MCVRVFNVRSLQHDIIELNTEEQLYERGVDSEGRSLGAYSFVTKYHYKPIAAKEGRDGRTDHVTLKDTGDFYRSFRFKNEKDGFYFEANTIKEDTDLAEVFGKEIIGLTNQSKADVSRWIKEPLQKETIAALQK